MNCFNGLMPSDNEYGIPVLLPQAPLYSLPGPFVQWGEVPRSTRYAGGTVGFYVDDYRFTRIEREPNSVMLAGYAVAIEPNYSVGDDSPKAAALWATYRKRWMARYWQTQGLSVVVDLNTAAQYGELNLLGVPDGWQAYATRGASSRMADLQAEYDLACLKAQSKPTLFVVYGGGKAVEAWARERGVLHVLDRLTKARREGASNE